MSIKEHPPQDEAADESTSLSRLHVPVLLEATLGAMRPKPGESYLDLTAGYGGHANAFLRRTHAASASVLVDRDNFAIEQLASFKAEGATILHSDFVSAAEKMVEEGRRFDLVLVDLGVSSPQLDRAERGFSFSGNGPLDMRMDRRQGTTAADLVNTATSMELRRMITDYGEERPAQAKRIADVIVTKRPFTTTKELADAVLSAHRGRWQRTHPATRTFQALRIAVNDELGQIERLLPLLPQLLATAGRVGIISFHSLEDRLVKRYFKEQADAGYESNLTILTKKPLAGVTEDAHNPRSRSAKLRVAVKK